MAEESGSLWSTAKRATVYTIATAAVGGLITWVTGWLPALWGAVKAAAVWTWDLLTLPIPVPLAIFAILCLSFIWIGRATRRDPAPVAPEAPQEEPNGPLPQLDEVDLSLLRLLSAADGRFVNFEDATHRLHVPRLVLERTCELLTQRGFIEPHRDRWGDPQIGLTRAGRDYVIEQGFPLGSPPGSW